MPASKKSKTEHPPADASSLLHYYRKPALSEAATASLLKKAKAVRGLSGIKSIQTEYCFNVQLSRPLSAEERTTLVWLLSETFEPDFTAETSFLKASGSTVEIGPRLSYESPWSTNAVSVCKGCGLDNVVRIERSRRYLVSPALNEAARKHFVDLVHDRMTETEYTAPLLTFGPAIEPKPTKTVPVMTEGRKALEKVNEELGLGFDDWDLDYYTNLFAERMGRDPSDCEVFDMAQSNSEHSRHWFFSGRQARAHAPRAPRRARNSTLLQARERANSHALDRGRALCVWCRHAALRGEGALPRPGPATHPRRPAHRPPAPHARR